MFCKLRAKKGPRVTLSEWSFMEFWQIQMLDTRLANNELVSGWEYHDAYSVGYVLGSSSLYVLMLWSSIVACCSYVKWLRDWSYLWVASLLCDLNSLQHQLTIHDSCMADMGSAMDTIHCNGDRTTVQWQVRDFRLYRCMHEYFEEKGMIPIGKIIMTCVRVFLRKR